MSPMTSLADQLALAQAIAARQDNADTILRGSLFLSLPFVVSNPLIFHRAALTQQEHLYPTRVFVLLDEQDCVQHVRSLPCGRLY